MKIRTQQYLSGLLSLILVVAASATLLATTRDIHEATVKSDFAESIVLGMSQLRSVMLEYMLSHADRPKAQWMQRHGSLAKLMDTGIFDEPDERGIMDEQRERLRRLKETFEKLVRTHDSPAGGSDERALSEEREAQLTAELLSNSQQTRSDLTGLAQASNATVGRAQRRASLLVMGCIVAIGATLLANAVLMQKSVLRPISELQTGMALVGAGNLDFRTAIGAQNEIGELSRNFDAMTLHLAERNAALRESEERYRTLYESSADGIVQVDLSGRIVAANRAYLDMLGYTLDEAAPLTQIQLTPPAWHAVDADIVERQVFPRGYSDEYEKEYIRKDGTVFPVSLRTWLVRDQAGAPAGMWAFARDISERKRMEGERQRYATRLEEANKELESFSYSVSHDLRVPLRAVDGFSHMLQKKFGDTLGAEGSRLIGVVRDNTRRMGQLIDDILSFSRMGRKEMSPGAIDMTALARSAAGELEPERAGRDLDILVGEMPEARGDAAMLRLVWVNLIGNAIKFTRPMPSARIEVGGRAEEAENIYWVKDDGVGFDMEYVKKLFGVFQRLHGVEEFEGTGIGLAIVKRIVTRHGGRVWAEGKVNSGASFYFALPHLKSAPGADEAAASRDMEVTS